MTIYIVMLRGINVIGHKMIKSRTKLSNTALEKKLGVGATTRNWKSVNALLAAAQS